MAGQMMRSLRYRQGHPETPFYDISYAKVRSELPSVIDGLYAFCGLEPSEQTYVNVARWEADNPKNKQGAWSYAAEAFGFNNHDIRREFADYYAWIEAEGICEWGN
jgi:hypothetical protein